MRIFRRMRPHPLLAVACLALPAASAAQTAAPLRSVTRAEAIAAADTAGSRALMARTDTAVASALARIAAAYPNPALSASYSKSLPQYHLSVDQPIEYPWMRSARVDAAAQFRRAALYRNGLELASLEVETDTLYTATLAAAAHARLSQLTAVASDSLLTLARLRRDAGDASELDVELAAVNAGQAANASAADSLAAIAVLLELQRVMGLPADRQVITPADSLRGAVPAAGPAAASDSTVAPLAIAAAQADVRGAEHVLKTESNSVFATPSVFLGFDAGDSTQPGILPTFGISLPLPLWSARSGEIAAARAGLARAQQEYLRVKRESDAAIARAQRELDAARARVARDERVLSSARRVASMALTAYAEGAAPLPTVLEAQRTARDAFGRYVDDLAAVQNAAALLRLRTLTAPLP